MQAVLPGMSEAFYVLQFVCHQPGECQTSAAPSPLVQVQRCLSARPGVCQRLQRFPV
jgi:hypothetical protein